MARKRVRAVEQNSNGFQIAEADLQERGPGDMLGTKQSGQQFNLFHAEFEEDRELHEAARKAAAAGPPGYCSPRHSMLGKFSLVEDFFRVI